MSLYYEAASILSDNSAGGSLKSKIYNVKNLQSNASQIYAVISESLKWSPILKTVIEEAGILALEKKVCLIPRLSHQTSAKS